MSQDSISGSRKETQFSTDTLKYVHIQELENHDPHLFIAAVAELSHQTEPVFAFQFLPCNSLGYIQEFLCHETFECAERLFLKYPAYLSLVDRVHICGESTPGSL